MARSAPVVVKLAVSLHYRVEMTPLRYMDSAGRKAYASFSSYVTNTERFSRN
jgi:hypothetical protein